MDPPSNLFDGQIRPFKSRINMYMERSHDFFLFQRIPLSELARHTW